MKINLALLWLLLPFVLLTACNRDESVSSTTKGLTSPAVTEAVAVAPEINQATEAQGLAEFFHTTFERDVSWGPEFQSYLSRENADNSYWDDYSETFAQKQNQQIQADLERLHTDFDFDALSESAQISYRIFEHNQQRDLRNFKWHGHNYAVTQMNNIAAKVPAFLQNIHKVATQKDAEAYISRLAGSQAIVVLKNGAVPMEILEHIMDDYIKDKSGAQT